MSETPSSSGDQPAPLSRREARAAAAQQPNNVAGTRDEAPSDATGSDSPVSASALPAAAVGTAAGAGAAAAGRPDPHARASAGLEDLFTGERTTEELGAPPPPPNKRRRRLGGWIALAIVVVILGGVAAGGLYVWNTYEDKIRAFMGWEEPKDYDAGIANGDTTITIASGDTGSPISQKLYDAGVTKTPQVFYDYLISTKQNPNFQPGVYKLQKQMTAEAALATLLDPSSRMQNGAVLPEGLTVDQSIQRLADGTGIPLADFQAAVANPAQFGVAAESLEGWLFPATYQFDPGVTATQVIQRLVNRTVQSLDQAKVAPGDRERILTIASIIQREGRNNDFAKVSRVIQNRLAQGMKLQMDSTAQYGYGELHKGSASTSNEAQFNDNKWNTYVITGLPATPIASPGDAAIDAALHPADGDWLYFVTVNLDTGETVFSSNAADHEAAVKQWQAWCSQNPNSGC